MKPTKPYVIGIIGGSGTGKTHFAKYITKYLQGMFIEGDLIGRKAIVMPEIIEGISTTFGRNLLLEDGTIDRKALGAIVFGRKEQLEKLNAIIHPAMYNIIQGLISSCEQPFVILEAAVMIEAGFAPLIQSMWYIKADEDIRLRRLMDARGIDEDKARNMIASGRDDYRKYSDYIIDTTWGLEAIQDEIDRILDEIKEICNE